MNRRLLLFRIFFFPPVLLCALLISMWARKHRAEFWLWLLPDSGGKSPEWVKWVSLLICVLAGIPALMRWRRDRLRLRRIAGGQCPVCGYDLRESKERCPECGTVVIPELVEGTAIGQGKLNDQL